jgi:hypothetical protein
MFIRDKLYFFFEQTQRERKTNMERIFFKKNGVVFLSFSFFYSYESLHVKCKQEEPCPLRMLFFFFFFFFSKKESSLWFQSPMSWFDLCPQPSRSLFEILNLPNFYFFLVQWKLGG